MNSCMKECQSVCEIGLKRFYCVEQCEIGKQGEALKEHLYEIGCDATCEAICQDSCEDGCMFICEATCEEQEEK